MDSEIIEQYLPSIRSIFLFSYLTEDELKKFLSITEIIKPAKGEILIEQGSVSPFFYGIIKGSVDVVLQESGDSKVFICKIEKGEVFGESAIFMAERRIADVTSNDETELLRIHRKEMMTFIKNHPQVGNKILMLIIYTLLTRLKGSNAEIAFEKHIVIDPDDIDVLVQDFMTR